MMLNTKTDIKKGFCKILSKFYKKIIIFQNLQFFCKIDFQNFKKDNYEI